MNSLRGPLRERDCISACDEAMGSEQPFLVSSASVKELSFEITHLQNASVSHGILAKVCLA